MMAVNKVADKNEAKSKKEMKNVALEEQHVFYAGKLS